MSERAFEIAAEEEFDSLRDLMEEAPNGVLPLGMAGAPEVWFGGALEDDYSERSTP